MCNEKIEEIRSSYDLAAEDYAKTCFNELDYKPFDRNIIERFSKLTADKGKVCDLGCGPGEVACFLKKCGLDVIGVDISPEMVKIASKLSPGIEYIEGDMFALPFADDSLAGIAAFYTIVNYEPQSLNKIFTELFRVVSPEGYLILAFHTGKNEVIKINKFMNKNIELNFCYFDTDEVIKELESVGFIVEEAVIRYPYREEYQTKRAYISARKPNRDEDKKF